MSYCRFSTRCRKGDSDIYIWASDDDKYHLAVASNRIVGKDPYALFGFKSERIKLPFVGKHFTYKTIKPLLKKIDVLKGLGYNIPVKAIKELKKEMKENL